MACKGSIQSTENKAYYLKYISFLNDGANIALLEKLKQSVPNGDISAHVTNNKPKLIVLKKQRLISNPQFDMLFPTSGQPDPSNFDIKLLTCLLRKTCLANSSVWDSRTPPSASDLSVEADVARLRNLRNKYIVHPKNRELTKADFEAVFSDTEKVMLRLGSTVPDFKTYINEYKTKTIDPLREAELLKEFHTCIDEVKRKQEDMQQQLITMAKKQKRTTICVEESDDSDPFDLDKEWVPNSKPEESSDFSEGSGGAGNEAKSLPTRFQSTMPEPPTYGDGFINQTAQVDGSFRGQTAQVADGFESQTAHQADGLRSQTARQSDGFRGQTAQIAQPQPPAPPSDDGDGGLPGGFSTLDPYWIELYLQTLLDGKEKHMSVRLMMIGHEGVGKTTLTRNLMNRSIEDVETTNGIEVHVKTCAVDTTGKWKESENNDRDSKMIERIARIAEKESDQHNEIDQTKSLKPSDGWHSLSQNSISEKPQLQTTAENDDNFRLPVEKGGHAVNEAGGPETPVSNENARKVIHFMLSNTESLPDITVSIWDFGGQFIFYATHQLFHSPRAVYLLVIDLSKSFQDMIDYGNPLSSNANNQRNVESFIKFWMHSIHAFASSDSGEPPVILIGTFRDKIGGEERSKEEYAEKYFDDIRALFDGTSLSNHIQSEQYFLDNLEPDKASLVHLKNSIMEIAKRQSSWNQEIPAKWILLEQALNQIKDGPYITFSKVCEMASKIDVPITNVDEIRLFLMFHHFTGDFVYFNEDELMNYVILNPQWIIDAFKSIITLKRFCNVRSHLRGIWHEFETTAVLKDKLIDEVWNNDDQNDFLSERDLILKYLVRLGIMSRVKVFHEDSEKVEELDYYLVPSILPMKEDTYFIDNLFSKATSTAVVAVIKLENSHISPTIYHRVTAAALGKWAVVESCGSRLLYGNMGVYKLDMQHVGMAKLTDKTLELSVYNLCGKPINNEKADAYRRFISNVIKHELNRFHAGKETLFMTMFRCNCSSTHTHPHIPLAELQGNDSIPCLMTVPAHNIDAIQAYNEWFIEVDILVQRQPVTSGRTLGEKELGHISKSIGHNWKLLGIYLGIPHAQLERIQMDYPHSSLVQIMHMLLTWKRMAGESATLETLVRVMRENSEVTIDWDTIKDTFDVFETEVKTVY